MPLKVRINEQNYSIEFRTINKKYYFDLEEEYLGIPNSDKSRLICVGELISLHKHGDGHLFMVKPDDETDENAYIGYIANPNEGFMKEVADKLIGKRVRVECINRMDEGQYHVSIGLVPEIKENVVGRVLDAIDHGDWVEVILDSGKYRLAIPNIDPEENSEFANNLKFFKDYGFFLDLNKNGEIVTLLGAAPYDEDQFAYARICFYPLQYEELMI